MSFPSSPTLLLPVSFSLAQPFSPPVFVYRLHCLHDYCLVRNHRPYLKVILNSLPLTTSPSPPLTSLFTSIASPEE
ncbi:hypothetical protein CBS63078_1052 [Aspergillus niger]|nr:hypothetical protein CBS115989_4441 [Aspergillus niger]KAI2832237.1 hypothetical protein CBS133816_1721 [Aspergillus niger]KAI2843444.1 hypothetical protein CBS11350_5313 [Aspergillus niger]KAI2855239.1 hypothetical protein CBS11232_4559 [Aspergillus niger]KAI2867088.1 hypothetical protein CBS12448_526 [Aspergillus niger]